MKVKVKLSRGVKRLVKDKDFQKDLKAFCLEGMLSFGPSSFPSMPGLQPYTQSGCTVKDNGKSLRFIKGIYECRV